MIKVVLLVASVCQLLSLVSSACYVPKEVKEFVWNPVDLEDEGYYFPMGSLSSLNPKSNVTLPGVSKNCPARLLWKQGSSDAIFYGCGNKQSHFACDPTDNAGGLWKLDCKHLSRSATTPDLSHSVWGTLTDNRSFVFINRCFYNINQQDWIVYSTTKEIPSTTRFEILVHAAMQDYWMHRQK